MSSSMLTLASMLPLQEYRSAWGVSPRAVLLCGDCNGSHRGRVGSYLRSQARVPCLALPLRLPYPALPDATRTRWYRSWM